MAGATIGLVDKTYTADAAVGLVADGTTNTNHVTLTQFPYMPMPAGGYQSTPGTGGWGGDGPQFAS